MTNNNTNGTKRAPPLKSFDPWKLDQPDDGIVYLYRSAVDGFWHVINDEDMALEEATNYPIGELVEYEMMGDYTESESGELRAIYVHSTTTESDTMHDDNETCPVCGEEYNMFVDNGYRNGWPTEGGDVAMIKFEVCTTSDSDWMYVHTEGVSQIMCGDGLAAIQNSNTDE